VLRKAFLMSLKPGNQEIYQQRHNPIPAEMEEVLKTHGVSNYSIFLHRQTDSLFAYVEIESEALWEEIASTEACRHWWGYMKELMWTNVDDSPIATPLDEVFHLD
jgi:L-rhamnose mutarotase